MRKMPLKRRPKRRKPVDLDAAHLWRLNLGPCVYGNEDCDGPVQGHHIITRQSLRTRHLDSYVWDVRNRMALCKFHHEQHHSRYRPISAEFLPDSAWEFAGEIGMSYYLERFYP